MLCPDLGPVLQEFVVDSPFVKVAQDDLPHYPDVVYGWKILNVSKDGTLYSPHRETVWPSGQYLEANKVPDKEEGGFNVPGIHAVMDEKMELLGDYVSNNSALVRVAMVGKIVEHDNGYRCQSAYPSEIYLASLDKANLIRAKYPGVEVSLIEESHGEAIGLVSVIYDVNGNELYRSRLQKLQHLVEEAVKQGADLRGANLNGIALAGMNFMGTNLEGVNLSNAFGTRCLFSAANLQGAYCEYIDLSESTFLAGKLRGAFFGHADLEWVVFESADLRGANFTEAQITNTNFRNADLRGANFQGASFRGRNSFEGANLGGVLFDDGADPPLFSPSSILSYHLWDHPWKNFSVTYPYHGEGESIYNVFGYDPDDELNWQHLASAYSQEEADAIVDYLTKQWGRLSSSDRWPKGILPKEHWNKSWRSFEIGFLLRDDEVWFLGETNLNSRPNEFLIVGHTPGDRADWEELGRTRTKAEAQQIINFLTRDAAQLQMFSTSGWKMQSQAKEKMRAHLFQALGSLPEAEKWIYLTVFGSGASYNWDEEGDFDIQVWCDHAKYIDLGGELEADDFIAEIRRCIQPINFPSFKDLGLSTDECNGDMLIQYYPKLGTGSPEENLAQKPYACYDMETDEWIVKPQPITPKFYGDFFLMVKPKAEMVAQQAESMIESYERNVIDAMFWFQLDQEYPNQNYATQWKRARKQAELDREGIHNLFLHIFEGRKDAYGDRGRGMNDERDILQKMLEVWGTFQRLRHVTKDTLPWEEQEMPDELTKASSVQWIDSGSVKPWEDTYRRPLIWDAKTETLYIGSEGTMHIQLLNELYDRLDLGLDLSNEPSRRVRIEQMFTGSFVDGTKVEYDLGIEGIFVIFDTDAAIPPALAQNIKDAFGDVDIYIRRADGGSQKVTSVEWIETGLGNFMPNRKPLLWDMKTETLYIGDDGAEHMDILWELDEIGVDLDLDWVLEGGLVRDDPQIARTFAIFWNDLQTLPPNLVQSLFDAFENIDIYIEAPGRILRKIAARESIKEKAQRLRQSGQVSIISNGYNYTIGRVQGDHGIYTTQFWRENPSDRTISMWQCECPWNEYAWGRTRKWRKYEGRPCSHVLALYWESLSRPLDETPPTTTPQPGQRQERAPVGPGQQRIFNPNVPEMGGQPIPEPVPYGELQQGITTGPNSVPIPGSNNPSLPSAIKKGPNQVPPKQPTPVPVPRSKPQEPGFAQQLVLGIPGAFSHWKEAAFGNGDIVRANKPLQGIDRDGADRTVPRNSKGEVLYSDELETIVIFPLHTGELEPHLVRVEALTSELSQSSGNPFIKKRRSSLTNA